MSVSVIHQTDLFRPHMDPDDHWDLATIYALATAGDIDLRGILIDSPPHTKLNPDVMAVAQMNHITGLSVPCAVGSSLPMRSRRETQACAPVSDRSGVEFLLSLMRGSSSPLVINVVGSCRDVALAANSAPELFESKCAAIYLNAGYGSNEIDDSWELEYNVRLDRPAFAALFDVPCPVYWLPCFEDMRRGTVQEWGTFWRFRERDLLQEVTPDLQRYFAFMLGRLEQSGWFGFLHGGDVSSIFRDTYEDFRNMWNTAGFLHVAGRTVSTEGEIVTLGEPGESPVYGFEPIGVTCDDGGVTRWRTETGSTGRYIFHVCSLERYQEAMTRALTSLLSAFGTRAA
ncbi:MAG: hypothetical protein WBD30_04375 [Bacteroidota bacterium]